MAKEQTTKLDDQIIVRMTSETKDKFMARVKSEGKTSRGTSFDAASS